MVTRWSLSRAIIILFLLLSFSLFETENHVEHWSLTSRTLGGNPRSVDRKTAAFLCRSPLGGVALGGVHGLKGPVDHILGGAVLHPTH